MKRYLILAVFLLGSVSRGEPGKQYWTFVGYGIPLVQCELVNNKTEHCRYLSPGLHPLDGVMEAVHRATKGREQ
jgi:hypothetical protein